MQGENEQKRPPAGLNAATAWEMTSQGWGRSRKIASAIPSTSGPNPCWQTSRQATWKREILMILYGLHCVIYTSCWPWVLNPPPNTTSYTHMDNTWQAMIYEFFFGYLSSLVMEIKSLHYPTRAHTTCQGMGQRSTTGPRLHDETSGADFELKNDQADVWSIDDLCAMR